MYGLISLGISFLVAVGIYVSGGSNDATNASIAFIAMTIMALIIKKIALFFVKIMALMAFFGIAASGFYYFNGDQGMPQWITKQQIKTKSPNSNVYITTKETKDENWHPFIGSQIDTVLFDDRVMILKIYDDMCPVCIFNEWSVFSSEEFLNFSKKNNIHLTQAKFSDTENANLKLIINELKIQGAPTVVMFSKHHTRGKMIAGWITSSYLMDQIKKELT